MRRPAHGATAKPGPCRPENGYGRALGRPGRSDLPRVDGPIDRAWTTVVGLDVVEAVEAVDSEVETAAPVTP